MKVIFYYKQPYNPSILEVIPSEGTVAGGNVITITGKNLLIMVLKDKSIY